MDSGVLGLGAVAWRDAWNAAAPEAALRLPVDPERLLALLRDLPVARALLADLQRAAAAGRSVEVIVSPDRQVAEVATGSAHYVLTAPARDSVLAELVGRPQVGAASNRASVGSLRQNAPLPAATSAPARAPAGILWEAPTAAARDAVPSETLALPWLGPAAYLEVRRDGANGAGEGEEANRVYCATLHLQLPQLGRFDAHIRVCGSTVAVSIECARGSNVEPRLVELQQRLSAQGLVSAHVGMARSTP
jgi:hypothetical protein